MPNGNHLRGLYEKKAEVAVTSITAKNSPIQGGIPLFQTPFENLPCLTAMSPNGELFAIAYGNGLLDIHGENCGQVRRNLCCEHSPSHKVTWMYLNASSLVAEYACGSVCKLDIKVEDEDEDEDDEDEDDDDDDDTHYLSAPPMPSHLNIFSTCSQDRSTILRLVRRPGHDSNQDEGSRTPEENLDGFVVIRPGDTLSLHILDCESWEKPRELGSLEISESLLLDPRALAISRNNKYAAVVLLREEEPQYNVCRRLHVWSIKDKSYLGCRDVRGPKWESWVPANHFDTQGDFRFLHRQDGDTPPDELNSFVDVYDPDQVPISEDSQPHQLLSDNWVFFADQTQTSCCSAGLITFAFNISNQKLRHSEFAYDLDLKHLEVLASCMYANISMISPGRAPSIPSIGAFRESVAALTRFIQPTTDAEAAFTTHDVAVAARNVVIHTHNVAIDAADAARAAANAVDAAAPATDAAAGAAARDAALAARVTALATLVPAVLVDASLVDIAYTARLEATFDNALDDTLTRVFAFLTTDYSVNNTSLEAARNAAFAAARDAALFTALSASRAAAAHNAAAYNTVYKAAYAAGRDAALSAIRDATPSAAHDTTLSTARDAALAAALSATHNVAFPTALAPAPAAGDDTSGDTAAGPPIAHETVGDGASHGTSAGPPAREVTYAAVHDATCDAALAAVRDAAGPAPLTAATTVRDTTSDTLLAKPWIRCYGTFGDKSKEVFEVPRHLVLPPLINPRIHPSHQCGGSRVVLGGHVHPYNRDTWVPVCILDFGAKKSAISSEEKEGTEPAGVVLGETTSITES